MNANYINKHLISLSELFYGKDSECYSNSFTEGKKKKKKEYFVFGSKKLNVENMVNKQIALFLVTGQFPLGMITKTRYQITYTNLETNSTFFHSNAAVFTPEEAREQIKLLKAEQKQMKKLDLPKTKANFETKKVTLV